ncbi:hypothetical protein TNCV_2504701 [Trichonephila clavipes]|uniref:Uncharacterized protein n=1 Tax=Trichonephila clavipes TaxID=2585209 RepID=A0A8X6WGL1_TRICX|nr:hypothetical protein TNCV_2504701 [Trichonephila clavipes]
MIIKSVVSLASIVGYNSCHAPRHRIKRGFRCVLGVQQFMRLPHISKVDLVYPGPVVVQARTTRFRLAIYRENKQTEESIQSDG